jgi:TonB family protein
MVSRLCVLFCCLTVCLSLAAQTDDPELISGNMPRYPPLARQARIEGIVKVTFTLPPNAEEPANVEASSGHPVLKAAAVENVKTWHFKNPYAAERKYETTFRYRLGPQRITFESFHNVEIVIPEPPPIDANY